MGSLRPSCPSPSSYWLFSCCLVWVKAQKLVHIYAFFGILNEITYVHTQDRTPKEEHFASGISFFELLKNFSYFHIDLILLHFWLLFDLILLSPLLISKKHKLTLSHWVAGWFDSHPLRSQFLLSGCRPLVPKCRKSHALLQQPSINQTKIKNVLNPHDYLHFVMP